MKEQFFESLYFDVKINITDDNGEELSFEKLSKEDKKNILYEIYNNNLQGEIVSEVD